MNRVDKEIVQEREIERLNINNGKKSKKKKKKGKKKVILAMRTKIDVINKTNS